MTPKEKLYYLVSEYQKGNYDTNTFCNQFTVIYSNELDYDTLSKIERKMFRELLAFTSRFSPFEEDLKIPNVYYNEEDVKLKVEEVVRKLKI